MNLTKDVSSLGPALREQLWFGKTYLPAQTVEEGLCLAALVNPQSLKQWPLDLLESDRAAGLLGQLAGWTYLQDAIEKAPPMLPVEASLEKSRVMAARLLPFFQSSWFLSSWFWRERARLTGMQGRDPLPELEKSLQLATHYGQLAEIGKCRTFLVRGGPEESIFLEPGQRADLAQLLEITSRLARCHRLQELRESLVAAAYSLAPLAGVVWLSKPAEWEALSWSPPGSTPRFSQSVAEKCRISKELTWGQPEQLHASRSVMLSQVQCLLALPLDEENVLFVWQSENHPWLSTEELRVLSFLCRLAQVVHHNLRLIEQARSELELVQRAQRRWESLFAEAQEVSLAEVDDQHRILRCNPAFQQLFPLAQPGVHVSDLLPDPALDRQRLSTSGRAGSCLVRLGEGAQSRWIQVSDWKVSGQSGAFRALVDLTERELSVWFEYLEEFRHLLAADLHDGPVQLAAVGNLTQDSPRAGSIYRELRDRLNWLRSPWLEGLQPEAWLEEFLRGYLSGCQLELSGSFQGLTRMQEQGLFRILLSVIEKLAAGGMEKLRLELGRLTRVCWTPATELELDLDARAWVNARVQLLHAEMNLLPGDLRLTFLQG